MFAGKESKRSFGGGVAYQKYRPRKIPLSTPLENSNTLAS